MAGIPNFRKMRAGYIVGCDTRRMARILAASLSVVLARCGGEVVWWLTDNENIVS